MLHDKYLENLYQSEVVFLKYLPIQLLKYLGLYSVKSFDSSPPREF